MGGVISGEYEDGCDSLLNTIRIPNNIHKLYEKLPKPNY